MALEVNVSVDGDLIAIARGIVARNLSPTEWAAIESDDEFEHGRFVGGYDATESAFCFAARSPDGRELWFQFDLETVPGIASGRVRELSARDAQT